MRIYDDKNTTKITTKQQTERALKRYKTEHHMIIIAADHIDITFILF